MMMGLIGGIGLLLIAVVIWRVVESAATGTLPRNGGIGIRTAATSASDEAWSRGHEAAVAPARRLAGVCGALAVLMMIVSVIRGTSDPDVLTVGLFVLGYAAVTVGCVWIAKAANRGARSTRP